MMRPMGSAAEDQLELPLAERAITRVLHSYSRGAGPVRPGAHAVVLLADDIVWHILD